jgi:hypothetical protein
MRTRTLFAVSLGLLGLVLPACGDDKPKSENGSVKQDPSRPPDHIAVDHILIAVTNPQLGVTRSAEDAKRIAYDLLAKLKSGADWDATKAQYSDDRPGPGQPAGGPYRLANHGVPTAAGEHRRGGMVPAFGDVGFKLAVGEIGMADHDPAKSPYGWHIIKRVQ